MSRLAALVVLALGCASVPGEHGTTRTLGDAMVCEDCDLRIGPEGEVTITGARRFVWTGPVSDGAIRGLTVLTTLAGAAVAGTPGAVGGAATGEALGAAIDALSASERADLETLSEEAGMGGSDLADPEVLRELLERVREP